MRNWREPPAEAQLRAWLEYVAAVPVDVAGLVEEAEAIAKKTVAPFNLGFEVATADILDAINIIPRLLAALEAAARRPGEGIYVASRASVLARGEMWRRYRAEGAPIISSWIDEDGPNDTADLNELWVRICREVTSAERLILYAEPDDFPLKGAFVEIGMALAAGVPITVVAPGVEISGRNQRPFGSWIRHPLVSTAATVGLALFGAPDNAVG